MPNEIIKELKIFIIIGIIFSITLLIGGYGFSLALQGDVRSYWDLVYLSLQLFVLQSGADLPVNNSFLQFARFFAPIVTLSAFALVIVIFLEQLQKLRIKLLKNHIVICGLGYLGLEITRVYAQSKNVIVIEKDPENPNIQAVRDCGVQIVLGDATQEFLLKMVQIEKTRDIYLVTGNDRINAEIAIKCHDINVKSGLKDLCGHVHLENQNLWEAFGSCSSHPAQSTGSHFMQMEFFNLYQIAGFCILDKHKPFSADEVRTGSANILIIGLGRLGESLLIRIIKKWRISNNEGKKIRITCIDINGERKENALVWKYHDIREWCDLSILSLDLTTHEFLKSEIFSEKLISGVYSRVYICLHDSTISTVTALRLANNPRFKNTEIIVRATYNDGITRIFSCLKQTKSLDNVHIFPIVSSDCCLDMIVHGVNILEKPSMLENIARVLHENYRKVRFEEGAQRGTDPALEPWDLLDKNIKESNRQQADHIKEQFGKMNIGFTILPEWPEPLFSFTSEEIEILARAEHERWMNEKIENGWKYGPIRDYNLKESPYLVDYDKLDEDIKERDRHPFRSIPAVLAEFDLKVIRLSSCDL